MAAITSVQPSLTPTVCACAPPTSAPSRRSNRQPLHRPPSRPTCAPHSNRTANRRTTSPSDPLIRTTSWGTPRDHEPRAAWAYAARRYYWRNHERAPTQRRAQTAVPARRSEDELFADLARLRPDGFRCCPRLQTAPPVTAFGRDRCSPDGPTSTCLACRAA